MADHTGEAGQSSRQNRSFEINVDDPAERTPDSFSVYFSPSPSLCAVEEIPRHNDNARPPWADLHPYRELYQAALRGNWKAAKAFLARNPDALTAKVAVFSETALHVAASEGHSEFVENILELMSPEEASEPDKFGRTALHDAAYAGSLGCAVALVKKCPNLTNVGGRNGWTPLIYAAVYGYRNKDLLWYLCLVTKDEPPLYPFTGPLAAEICLTLVAAGYLDILLYLFERYENLATAMTGNGVSLLSSLAAAPFNFFSSSRLGLWERWVYSLIPVNRSNEPPMYIRSIVEDTQQSTSSRSPSSVQEPHWTRRLLLGMLNRMTPSFFKRLQDKKLRHQCAVDLVRKACTKICVRDSLIYDHFHEYSTLRTAAYFGIIEIIKIMIEFCPDLLWHSINQYNQSLLHYSIINRREEIFNMFYNSMTWHKSGPVGPLSTLLHLAAKLAPLPQLTVVSGAALQMQRELQWFKAVERLIPPLMVKQKNPDGLTPQELFSKEHKSLAKAGEKWMRDTSNYCMIISTLIATFVFAAAFHVPGGNNSEGIPLFLWTPSFLVFAISDTLALFSSVTSLLMFFSVLTARYAEEDFLKSLPEKLVIGLSALFLSIATMTIAFSATLFIMLHERLKWISVPITLLALVPVSIFIVLQFPLFVQLSRATFGNSIFNPQSPW